MNDIDGRIRLCLLDDNPGFVNSETGLPTFAAASGTGGRRLLERNFQLSWMYGLDQAKAFAARARIAMIDDPSQLLRNTKYPNILWFDYCMDQAEHKARDLETLGSVAAYRETLDPLRGDWGRNYATFGLDETSFEREVEWKPLVGEDQHGGCIAGVDIASLFDHLAFVGVPQTIHHNLKATVALEWQLGCHLGPLFQRKSGALKNWYVFLKRALPALRDKLALGCRRGSLIPRISDLLELQNEERIDSILEHMLSFRSQLGTETLRVEALCLDLLYEWDSLDDVPMLRDAAAARKAVRDWVDDLLEEAAGPGRQTVVRDALATAAKFIAAHGDLFHYQRRQLSRELADARLGEIDTAVEQNAELLDALGFAPAAVARALREDKAEDLTLPDEMAAAWGTLGPIGREAPSPEAARYAALALLVWGEMAWQGTVRGNVDAWFLEVEELLVGHTLVGSAMRERLEALAGLYVPEDLVRPLRAGEDPIAYCAATLRTFSRQAAVFSNMQELVDLDGPRAGAPRPSAEPSSKRKTTSRRGTEADGPSASQETEAKHRFLRFLFAPAPHKLLLWREAGTDIDRPLARLGKPEGALKLSITAVLDEGTVEDGGMRPGELRLVQLFAREFGFAERYWPAWMHGKGHE